MRAAEPRSQESSSEGLERFTDPGEPPGASESRLIADYVRTVIPEGAAMNVEKRDQLLYEELLDFELRTT